MNSFNHSSRRFFKRKEKYQPVRFGATGDNTTIITIYLNPFTDSSTLFFENVYEPLTKDYLSDVTDVSMEIRPVAPEMCRLSTSIISDIKQVSKEKSVETQVSPSDIAEYLHAIREQCTDDDFMYIARRASLMAEPSLLTYEKLNEFTRGLQSDVDSDKLLRAVKNGTYKGRVRYDSSSWFYDLPFPFLRNDDNPTELVVFVNGELVRELQSKYIRRKAESTKAVIRLDSKSLESA